jgi:Tfp pilus assembly protein PilF
VQLARRLQEVAPSSQNAQQLAQAQFAAGQSEAAEQTLRAWMESHPDADNVALTLADLLNRVGRASEAAAVLRPLAEKHPKNAAVLNNLAWYLRESAPQEALAVAKQAIALAPDNLSVVDTYATVLALNGDFETALRAIDGAIQKAKDPAYFRLQRVAILERKGDKAAAAEELEAVEGAGLSPELQAKAEALGRSLGEK